jgi:transcriptional regulator with XRE-family HTH domain
MSKTLADKIDRLFETHLDEHGRQFTYGGVERGSNRRITSSYVWKLRTGAMSNPGLAALEALSSFFGVPLDYFAQGGECLEPALCKDDSSPRSPGERAHDESTLSTGICSLSDQHLARLFGIVSYLGRHQDAALS